MYQHRHDDMTTFGADGEYILWTAETGPLVHDGFLQELDVTGRIVSYTRLCPSKRDSGASVVKLHYHQPQDLYQRHQNS